MHGSRSAHRLGQAGPGDIAAAAARMADALPPTHYGLHVADRLAGVPPPPPAASATGRSTPGSGPLAPTVSVLLAVDGVVHISDLAVQSFARHATEELGQSAAEATRALIGGMRGFLEGRADLLPSDPAVTEALSRADDGDHAVEILCRAAGLTPRQIVAARHASRVDLANSAWAIDAAPGLPDLLAGIPADSYVAVVAHDLTGVPEVVDAVGIASAVDEFLVDAGGTEGREQVVDHVMVVTGTSSSPDRLLVVGSRWDPDLAVPHAAGCTTALVDRFERGRGTPTWRDARLAGLIPEILHWASFPGAGRA